MISEWTGPAAALRWALCFVFKASRAQAETKAKSHMVESLASRKLKTRPQPQVIGREQQPHHGDSFSLAATASMT